MLGSIVLQLAVRNGDRWEDRLLRSCDCPLPRIAAVTPRRRDAASKYRLGSQETRLGGKDKPKWPKGPSSKAFLDDPRHTGLKKQRPSEIAARALHFSLINASEIPHQPFPRETVADSDVFYEGLPPLAVASSSVTDLASKADPDVMHASSNVDQRHERYMVVERDILNII